MPPGGFSQGVGVHPKDENASMELREGIFYGGGPGIAPAAMVRTMSRDERGELVYRAAEAHSGLNGIAFKLWRELGAEAPLLKAALSAEQEAFRLQREIELLDIGGPDQARRCEALPEVRRGGTAINPGRLRR